MKRRIAAIIPALIMMASVLVVPGTATASASVSRSIPASAMHSAGSFEASATIHPSKCPRPGSTESTEKFILPSKIRKGESKLTKVKIESYRCFTRVRFTVEAYGRLEFLGYAGGYGLTAAPNSHALLSFSVYAGRSSLKAGTLYPGTGPAVHEVQLLGRNPGSKPHKWVFTVLMAHGRMLPYRVTTRQRGTIRYIDLKVDNPNN